MRTEERNKMTIKVGQIWEPIVEEHRDFIFDLIILRIGSDENSYITNPVGSNEFKEIHKTTLIDNYKLKASIPPSDNEKEQ